MRRAAAGLGAVTGLLLGLVGVPIALLLIGTSTWPDSWSVAAVLGALTRPDDGQLLAVLLIVVGWVAWAVFAVSVVAEAIQLLPRSRVRIRIPGLGAPQRLAAMLLVAAIALLPTASPARATPPSPAPAPTMPVSQAAPIEVTRPTDQPPTEPPAAPAAQSGPSKRSTPATRERDGVVHRVVAGDDLWSLAESVLRRRTPVANHRQGKWTRADRRSRPTPDRMAARDSRRQVVAPECRAQRQRAPGDRARRRHPVGHRPP